MTMFLWDASNYDWSRGAMDLNAAYADGIRGFTHKATEGTGFVHDKYQTSLERARYAGIPYLGAYVVPRTPGNYGNGTVAEQLTFFMNYVNAHTPWWTSFPGWFWQVDTEVWSNSNGVYDSVSPIIGADMCSRLRSATGRQVIHYAPKWAYGDSIPGSDPLWASSYVTGSGPYRSLYPGDASTRWGAYSGRTPTILQYTSHATIGTQTTCDANAFRGTEADFAALIGADGEDMTPEEHKWLADTRYATTQIVYRDMGPMALQAVMGVVGSDVARLEGLMGAVLDKLSSIGSPTDDQVAQQAELIATKLAAIPEVPLGDADRPAIIAAVKQAMREGSGSA